MTLIQRPFQRLAHRIAIRWQASGYLFEREGEPPTRATFLRAGKLGPCSQYPDAFAIERHL